MLREKTVPVYVNGDPLRETLQWVDEREPHLLFSVTPAGAVSVTHPEVPNSTAEVEAHITALGELYTLLKTYVDSEVAQLSLERFFVQRVRVWQLERDAMVVRLEELLLNGLAAFGNTTIDPPVVERFILPGFAQYVGGKYVEHFDEDDDAIKINGAKMRKPLVQLPFKFALAESEARAVRDKIAQLRACKFKAELSSVPRLLSVSPRLMNPPRKDLVASAALHSPPMPRRQRSLLRRSESLSPQRSKGAQEEASESPRSTRSTLSRSSGTRRSSSATVCRSPSRETSREPFEEPFEEPLPVCARTLF